MLFLLLPLLAFAQDVRLTPYTAVEADETLKAYRQAVHLLETKNGRCTATEVSSEGHLLTARHCVQICLIQSGALRWMNEQGVVYFELDRTRLGQARCAVKLNGVEEKVTIEATSPGVILFAERNTFKMVNPDLFQKLDQRGFMDLGDFAILRREKPGSCVPLASAAPSVGAKVRSLGYPWKTERPGVFNSDGVNLHYTAGKVVSGIDENPCVKELTGYRYERAVEGFKHESAVMSTLDVSYGSSGSSMMNEKNEVAGVLTNMYAHYGTDPEKHFCYGSAKALRVEHIRGMFGGIKLECGAVAREAHPGQPSPARR